MEIQTKMLPITLMNLVIFISNTDGAALSKYGVRLSQSVRTSTNRTKTVVFKYRFQDLLAAPPRARILAAMKQWTDHTCVAFEESNTPDAILFKIGNGISTTDKDTDGKVKEISLIQSPQFLHDVLHGLGHVIGLEHEHSRTDRDDYLLVQLKNVDPSNWNVFDKFTWNWAGNISIPYDYESVLHYAKLDFSKNAKPVLITKDPAVQNVIGRGERVSFLDIKTVNLMYNCHRAQPECKKDHVSCPGEGFVGKDCQCLCRGVRGAPIQLCPGGPGLHGKRRLQLTSDKTRGLH